MTRRRPTQAEFQRLSRSQLNGCKLKIAYKHQKEAEAALSRTEAHGTPMEVYPCKFKKHWHIGHSRRSN